LITVKGFSEFLRKHMDGTTGGYEFVVGAVEAIVFDSDKPSEKIQSIRNVLKAFELVREEIRQKTEGGKTVGQTSTGA